MTIIVSKNGKDAQKIESTQIERESDLQKYVLQNSDIIPISDIDEDNRLLVITKEFPTSVGPVDAIGVDQRGQIYLIETKLYKNQDKRKVVAQVLDYGASLWKNYDVDKFNTNLTNQMIKNNDKTLMEKTKNFFKIESDEAETIIENMNENVENGNFKFVVLMDKLYDDLKNLILFLNQNSKFDIYAVEIKHYKYQENEIIIPKLFGNEVRKTSHRSVERGIYDENYHLENIDDEIKQLYQKLREEIMNFGDVSVVPKKIYIAFRRNSHFVYVELMKSFLQVVISLKKGELIDPDNLTEDVSTKGKHGNGDYRIAIRNSNDLIKYIPLIKQSYEKR